MTMFYIQECLCKKTLRFLHQAKKINPVETIQLFAKKMKLAIGLVYLRFVLLKIHREHL